jgi:hypothetical protein
MSVPKSFISYMKTMREYYKSGAIFPDPLPMDFIFDDMEMDACSYGFVLNNNQTHGISSNLMNNNIDSNDSESPAMEAAINSALEKQRNLDKLEHQQTETVIQTEVIPTEIIPTEIKIIRLFDQGEILLSLDSTTSVQHKPRLTIMKKITTALSRLIK